MELTAVIEGNELVLRIPLCKEGTYSASGKSRMIASSFGPVPTDLKVGDQRVTVSVNAYVKAATPHG